MEKSLSISNLLSRMSKAERYFSEAANGRCRIFKKTVSGEGGEI